MKRKLETKCQKWFGLQPLRYYFITKAYNDKAQEQLSVGNPNTPIKKYDFYPHFTNEETDTKG